MAASAAVMPAARSRGGDSVPAAPLDIALDAERWIRSHRILTQHGITWPWDPDQGEVVTNLYSGTPGVVLFYLELFHATGEQQFLDEARSGAAELAATLPPAPPVEPGLYVGMGGIGFAIAETGRMSHDAALQHAAHRCFELVTQSGVNVENGVAWPTAARSGDVEVTDIVSGAAGAGLALLYAHDHLGYAAGLECAARAGDRLLALSHNTSAGKAWPMYEGYPQWMPNFSHGTAGVSYFLAQLYHATGEQRFLAAAVAGAREVESLATTGEDWWRVAHHMPGGEELFYLSWCHGPPGTSRLFYSLSRTAADEGWMDRVQQGARGVVQSGIPERRTPGFWNNVSQCCGDAGVAEFFLRMARITKDPDYDVFVDRLVRRIAQRATVDRGGTKWIQAEHRVRPELLQAQTGFMQGAAGVGTLLVRVDGVRRGRESAISLPDEEW